MIITCPNCNTKFSLDIEALGKRGRKLRCSRCKHNWFQHPESTDFHAPIESDTTAITKSKTPPPSPSKQLTSSNRGYKWAASLLILALLATSLVSYRKELTNLLPFISRIYTTHEELSLRNVIIEKDKKTSAILVQADIVNQGKQPLNSPHIRATFLDSKHEMLGHMLFTQKRTIPGSGHIAFKETITKAPNKTASIRLELGHPLDFLIY